MFLVIFTHTVFETQKQLQVILFLIKSTTYITIQFYHIAISFQNNVINILNMLLLTG